MAAPVLSDPAGWFRVYADAAWSAAAADPGALLGTHVAAIHAALAAAAAPSRGFIENKHSTDVESHPSSSAGVIENKHSTDVGSPPRKSVSMSIHPESTW